MRMAAAADPVVLRHRDLEKIANVALRVGRVLMECGGRVSVVREGMRLAAQGLGAKVVGERVGYASLTLTVGAGEETITRMIDVGPHGDYHSTWRCAATRPNSRNEAARRRRSTRRSTGAARRRAIRYGWSRRRPALPAPPSAACSASIGRRSCRSSSPAGSASGSAPSCSRGERTHA